MQIQRCVFKSNGFPFQRLSMAFVFGKGFSVALRLDWIGVAIFELNLSVNYGVLGVSV